MNKIYEVLHYYDVDGGYGDAVPENNVIATFTEREKAKRFVEKYSKSHAYAKPYDYLYCGYLTINEREVNKEPDESSMWWLHNSVVEVTDDDDEDDED